MSEQKNPFVSKRGKAERTQQMLAALSTPVIANHSPEYQQMVQAQALQAYQQTESPQGKRLITVTLDQLKPYEGNPRKTKNPAYEEIKASIKSRGLDHAPNITQRPGDGFYTILDGGNTRLQALNELFKETHDHRFWSIECVFKPWEGEADDINSQLNLLIGHLAENDIRGELSFIEKALGIKEVKILYEKKYQEFFSHRRLAEKLGENGYPISHSILGKMEQCLTYLYPHIPNILLAGMGKPQIEKLLSIRKNATDAWERYQQDYPNNQDVDVVWMEVLSPFDEEPSEFSLNDFQDELIGQITEAFAYQIPYETFKFEINLDEQKRHKLALKQAEINQRLQQSEERLKEEVEQSTIPRATPSISSTISQPNPHNELEDPDLSTDIDNEAIPDLSEFRLPVVNAAKDEAEKSLPAHFGINELPDATAQYLADLGITPGVNPETKRADEATINGLDFANTGRQPVTNIWKIYPHRHHKIEAYSLAIDIAQECGFAHLVQHIEHEPIDYSFMMHPLDKDYAPWAVKIYDFLTALSTENITSTEQNYSLQLSPIELLGDGITEPVLSDLLLVRLYRLIRIVRYLKTQLRQGEHYA